MAPGLLPCGTTPIHTLACECADVKLKPWEEKHLQGLGAQAAARGHSWQSNPFLMRENMPEATGVALEHWSARHDAWQRGYESYLEPPQGA